jgi:hypothetical protein
MKPIGKNWAIFQITLANSLAYPGELIGRSLIIRWYLMMAETIELSRHGDRKRDRHEKGHACAKPVRVFVHGPALCRVKSLKEVNDFAQAYHPECNCRDHQPGAIQQDCTQDQRRDKCDDMQRIHPGLKLGRRHNSVVLENR